MTRSACCTRVCTCIHWVRHFNAANNHGSHPHVGTAALHAHSSKPVNLYNLETLRSQAEVSACVRASSRSQSVLLCNFICAVCVSASLASLCRSIVFAWRARGAWRTTVDALCVRPRQHFQCHQCRILTWLRRILCSVATIDFSPYAPCQTHWTSARGLMDW